MLKKPFNKKAGDKPIHQIVIEYRKSAIRMTKNELNYTEWSPVVLRQHQEKMASWACNAWKSYFVKNKK